MNPAPYPFHDFLRVRDSLTQALLESGDTYVLLTGDTGTGKTALLAEIRRSLDRAQHRVFYFSEAQKLGATSLIRVLARHLRVRTSLRHAESFDSLTSQLKDDGQRLLVLFDEAQDLPQETLAEARAMAESDLDGQRPFQVLFCGLPRLRVQLQSQAPLWRRIVIREELLGLTIDEVPDFLEHHFGPGQAKRLCDDGRRRLFEQSHGAPGHLVPMMRTLLARSSGKGRIDPDAVDEILQRWDLA